MYWSDEEKEKWHEHRVVVAGFRTHLEHEGWEVETDRDDIDVLATRGSETLVAEAKGLTGSGKVKGMHVVYGQILRRMTAQRIADPKTSFAVVIPAKAHDTALRVPQAVRDLLRITIYSVADDGTVEVVKGMTSNP